MVHSGQAHSQHQWHELSTSWAATVVGCDRQSPSLIWQAVIWQSTLKCWLIPSINICLDCRKFVCRYCLKASESPILMTRWEGILKIPAHTHTHTHQTFTEKLATWDSNMNILLQTSPKVEVMWLCICNATITDWHHHMHIRLVIYHNQSISTLLTFALTSGPGVYWVLVCKARLAVATIDNPQPNAWK